MKILVLSDTHAYLENARAVLARLQGKVDAVFHLGDHDDDAVALQQEFPKLPFHYVKGNNDYRVDTPSQKLVRLGGKTLLLTHGHKQRVYWNYDTISYWAGGTGGGCCAFRTYAHAWLWEAGGRVALFNPGSISLPRGGTLPTFGILTMEDGRIEGQLWNIGIGAFKRIN